MLAELPHDFPPARPQMLDRGAFVNVQFHAIRLFDHVHPRARLSREKCAPVSRDRRKSTGLVAEELMTSPAVTVMRTTPVADAARLMETAGVRRLPVIDIAGRLVGIVTNRDLLKVFLRPDDTMKLHIVDLFSTVDGGRSSVLAVEVRDGDVVVTGEVDRRSVAESLTARIAAVDGVVSVVNRVSWLVDDAVNAMPVAGF